MTSTTTPTRWSKMDWVIVALLVAMAGWVFLAGITWGLPSRKADPFLFGDRRPWSGAEILKLAPQAVEGDRGADVDANPITDRHQAVVLNETDQQRAEIVRRYRLYSYQPDEMITFKSLSGIRPGKLDLDPRLYQYGGLWIYPVGVLLKASSVVGLIDVRSDAAWYLDHPDEFGKFYVVARAYSAAWAVGGMVVVYWLVRRLTGSIGAAAAAGVCFAWMPAVVNAAHEAKPHMAGAVLMLLTGVAGLKFVEGGKRRWGIAAGMLAGASVGMVLSGLWAFAVLPVMIVMRGGTWRERAKMLVLSVVCGVGVYVVTNPYVAINAVFRPSRLMSNIGNSTAMYGVGGSSNAVVNAVRLIAEGASIVVAVVGVVGLVVLVARGRGGWKGVAPLGVMAAVVLGQFVLLAGGKPGEYGRFALVVDVVLAMAAVVAIAGVRWVWARAVCLVGVAGAVVWFGGQYVWAFVRDAGEGTSRLVAAEELKGMVGDIGLRDEPAPYLMPPVDLFERRIVLLRRGAGGREGEVVDWVLAPLDDVRQLATSAYVLPSGRREPVSAGARITWADKQFDVRAVRPVKAEATRTGLADSGLR